MDPAVGMVESYLRVNGYFTVTEYPSVEAPKYGEYRTATDLDVLAFRFPGAGRLVPFQVGKQQATQVLTHSRPTHNLAEFRIRPTC